MRINDRAPLPVTSRSAPRSHRSIPQIQRSTHRSDSAPAMAPGTTPHSETNPHLQNRRRSIPFPPSDAPPETASPHSSQTLSTPARPPPLSYSPHRSIRRAAEAPTPPRRSDL